MTPRELAERKVMDKLAEEMFDDPPLIERKCACWGPIALAAILIGRDVLLRIFA